MVAKRIPLVHEIGDPREFMNYKHGEITHYNYMPPTIEVKDKDVFICDNSGPGGLGDPIERDPAQQKEDLDAGLTNADISRRVYGIEAKYDEKAKLWKVDEAVTKKLRDAKRKERLSRAMPVKQWWQQTRQRVAGKQYDPLLVEMYRSSMKMSEGFAREYKGFWGLPGEFTY